MYFYTKEQEKWLKDNVDKHRNTLGLTEDFNNEFKSNRKASAIRKKLNYLLPNHKWGHSGGKEKGFGSSITARPIGSERWVQGYLYVKIADNPLSKNFTTADIRKNWVQKHRLLWERANGKISDNSIVVFLDGNRNNFDLKNLYCTKKEITTTMIRNGWFSENADVTLTAIKLCELKRVL